MQDENWSKWINYMINSIWPLLLLYLRVIIWLITMDFRCFEFGRLHRLRLPLTHCLSLTPTHYLSRFLYFSLSFTQFLSHTLTLTLTHPLSHSVSFSLSLSIHLSISQSLTSSLSHSLYLSHTYFITYSLTWFHFPLIFLIVHFDCWLVHFLC